jgi:uncharacterized protein
MHSVKWLDLTVADAGAIRDFYQSVMGWSAMDVSMDGYSDFLMENAAGNEQAGICHQRGVNAALPPQWLVYFEVADLAASLQKVLVSGGTIVDGPRPLAEGVFACISDPAGAVCALFQTKR